MFLTQINVSKTLPLREVGLPFLGARRVPVLAKLAPYTVEGQRYGPTKFSIRSGAYALVQPGQHHRTGIFASNARGYDAGRVSEHHPPLSQPSSSSCILFFVQIRIQILCRQLNKDRDTLRG